MTLRIGWFSTGAGPGSQRWRMFSAVLDATRDRSLDSQIAFVFCNRDRGEDEGTDAFLDLVEAQHVPLLILSSRAFRRARGGERSSAGQPLPAWRADYDRTVADVIASHQFDAGMLAGYMLIFTPEMSRRHPFLNLHPAEPGGPVGTWQDVIWELIESRAQRSGVMIHLATEKLDRGPVVAYCTYSLRSPEFDSEWSNIGSSSAAELRASHEHDQPLFLAIRRQGAAREVPLVLATLCALAERRVMLGGDGVVDGKRRPLANGLDLTRDVDAAVAAELGVS